MRTNARTSSSSSSLSSFQECSIIQQQAIVPIKPTKPLPLSKHQFYLYMHIEWRIKIPLHVSSSHATADRTRKKEGERANTQLSRGKVRQEEGKKNPARFVAMSSPLLLPIRVSVARSKTMETGKTIERQARGSLSLPNAHTFTHEKPTVLKFNRAAASRMPLSSTS